MRNFWYNVALAKNDKVVRLYINGILADEALLKQQISPNDYDLNFGPLDDYKLICDFEFLIDDLKIYSIFLNEVEIQSLNQNSFFGPEPAYVKIGCVDCYYTNVCQDNFHPCNQLEYYSGVAKIKRIMGWSWKALLGKSKAKGMVLCCKDY